LSVGNFIIVVTMFFLFFLAIFLPFPHASNKRARKSDSKKHDHTLGGHR
jgi:hypothetical protein